jgi:(R,R)-butanediol dehydrogenase/meso-butanediol dehydrogenase/diacetyl reductase
MRALVYHGNKDLRVESAPDPRPGPGQVRLRIDYCGICATDIEEYLYGPKFIASSPNPITGKMLPVITGHEMTGTVEGVGQGVSSVKRGDRVAVNGVLTCGKCWWCSSGNTTQCPAMAAVGFAIDGGLAEYMVWQASRLTRLPDSVSSEEAALVEPSSVAMHAVRRSRLRAGERVAVLGVGTVGMLAMQIARAMGGQIFAVDRRPMSLEMARQLGAEAVINPDETDAAQALRDLTGGVGPDVVIDAAGGRDTPRQAIQWARRGGRVVLVAIYTAKSEFDFNDIVSAEAEVIGSIAYEQRDIEDVVRLLSTGALRTSPLVSDVIGLEDVIEKGFARMMAPTKDVFRVLVAPSK